MKKYLLLLLAASSLTQAATFNVSTTAELRVALSNAATNGEDDNINLADGTYKTTDDGEGTFIYLSNEANALTLRGSSADNVILSGDKQHQTYNHNSTQYSSLVLESISFVDGNTSDNGGAVFNEGGSTDIKNCNFLYNNAKIGEGGGVYSKYLLMVSNSTFSSNAASSGGGFYSTSKIKIYSSHFSDNTSSSAGGGGMIYTSGSNTDGEIFNSSFINNTAPQGGGFYARIFASELTVTDSVFKNNSATHYDGGGFHSVHPVRVLNSKFIGNNANRDGGGFMSNTSVTVMSSIFTNNSSELASAFRGQYVDVINSSFIDNKDGIYLQDGKNHIIINSVFRNIGNEISGGADVIVGTLKNNYLDLSKVMVPNFPSNNIFNNVQLNFVDEISNDYRLTASSDLIDAGTIDIEGVVFPNTDLDGHSRISGGSIDIGPYEYNSTRPTINSVTYTGVAKEQSELEFTTNYTLADGREIAEVSYDFLNDGNYTSLNTFIFNTAGTFNVGVKVTDSEGEFSTTTTTVTIAELLFSEMTYEQKLIKAISPEYYELLIPEINSEKSESFSSGKQYVQDNLSEFSLVTEAAQATAVKAAITTGIADGENNVINNPIAYGLNIVVSLSKDGIAQLPSGWKMISIPEDVTDLSVFDDAKIVWFFNNETQAWAGYSSNSNVMQQMKDKNIDIITKLSAGDGIFIEM